MRKKWRQNGEKRRKIGPKTHVSPIFSHFYFLGVFLGRSVHKGCCLAPSLRMLALLGGGPIVDEADTPASSWGCGPIDDFLLLGNGLLSFALTRKG
eukprot:3633045-Amphidinium_carterae.1